MISSPAAEAVASNVEAMSFLASTLQGNPSQVMQRRQRGRVRSEKLIASGILNGCSPRAVPAW